MAARTFAALSLVEPQYRCAHVSDGAGIVAVPATLQTTLPVVVFDRVAHGVQLPQIGGLYGRQLPPTVAVGGDAYGAFAAVVVEVVVAAVALADGAAIGRQQ